jgi:hypothetical protein
VVIKPPRPAPPDAKSESLSQASAAGHRPKAPSPPKKVDIPPDRPPRSPWRTSRSTIAPEPLRQGNCRVRLLGQTKRRLVAPLSLHVSLTRTDRTLNGAPIELLTDGKWIVTPSNAEFQLPPLSENFDGDSRLRLVVYSATR